MARVRPAVRARLCSAALAAIAAACAGVPWSGEPVPAAEPPLTLIFQPPSDLPAPQGLTATSGLYRHIALQWDPVLMPGVAGYLVESGSERDGSFARRATLRDRGALAWLDGDAVDAPLADAETRFYRLRSFDREGRVSSLLSELMGATTAPLPDPPDGLHAYSRQPRSIPLVWRPASDPGVAGYTVERSPGPKGPFEVVAELDGRHTTHLLDTGLGNLRVLHYRVSSRNEGGERGSPSRVLRAVTKPAPLPPVGLHVASRRLGAIALAWESNVERDLEAYRLVRWRDGGAEEFVTWISATRTQAEDVAVGTGERVAYALTALDRDGLESRRSEVVRAEGPSYDAAATANASGVRLRWNPRAGEGFVRARVTRTRGPWGRRVQTTDAAEILDRDVAPGRNYRYVIELERADGSLAPASPPLEIEIPGAGDGFVEIQAPAPRIPAPGGNPR